MMHTCEICGKDFKSPQALSSHLRYKHSNQEDDRGVMNLKEDFRGILKDLGIKKARNVISDIFFDIGADDIENLENVLRKAGVTNPTKSLIILRWSQRIGKKPPEELLKDETKRGARSSVFEVYDRLMETEMKELLMQDVKARIAKKSGAHDKRHEETEELRALFYKLLLELRSQRRTLDREGQMSQRRGYRAWFCQDSRHPSDCVVCGNCGCHLLSAHIPPGGLLVCPRCRAEYLGASLVEY